MSIADAGDREDLEAVMRFSFVEGEKEISIRDIIYVENEKHRQLFHVGDIIYSMYSKLDEIEKCLEAHGFIRIHQSFLINMRYIKRISSYVLLLENGISFSVPKARYKKVKKVFDAYTEVR